MGCFIPVCKASFTYNNVGLFLCMSGNTIPRFSHSILNAIKIGKYKQDKELLELLMHDIECLKIECEREHVTYNKEV